MVAVRMVSEGVDVPRLAVGVYATSAATPLYFAQAVGRFVRSRRPGETFIERSDDQVAAIATVMSLAPDMLRILRAASHGFRSYEFGNAATELAKGMADAIDALVARAEGRQ